MQNPLYKKFNTRHILIHLVAIYFFQQGVLQLAVLTDIEFLEILRTGRDNLSQFTLTRRISFLTNLALFSAFGMIGGFLIALFISIKRKWFWLNSLIAFVMLYASINFLPVGVGLGTSFLFMDAYSDNLFLLHLFTGLFFISISMLFLFLKFINRFIQGRKKDEKLAAFQFESQKDEP